MVHLGSLALGVYAFLLPTAPIVSGKGFLHDERSSFTARMLDRDLQTAMEEVMGCGSRKLPAERSATMRQEIQVMWHTMPKNSFGNLDWRSLRYVAHRYFMHKSSMLVRGMEPQLALSDSDKGAADILSKQVPDHVNAMLGGEQGSHGYDIDDGAALLVALEQLVFDSESALLEQVYRTVKVNTERLLAPKHMKRMLEAYMVHWMLGEDKQSINILMRNRTLLEREFPHWQGIKGFVDGRLRLLDFQQAKAPKSGFSTAMMDRQYSFDDAHTVIGGITQSFQSYWQSECVTMKQQLAEMDRTNTGRVKLSDFYGTGLDADWRFAESESYLRELGALDESSPWLGKQVIIPNYLLTAGNCIVSTPHYLICCQNECEGLLREVEEGIGNSVADPQELLRIVGNLTSSSMEETVQLSRGLVEQLHIVAKTHGGVVPLHGRLFAQWLHYAFPRECPFPHKMGSFSKAQTLTPEQFAEQSGYGFIASQDAMSEAVAAGIASGNETIPDSLTEQDEQWMSQWNSEEEFFAEYRNMQAPWEGRGWSRSLLLFLGFIGVSVLAVLGTFSPPKTSCGSLVERVQMV